ncbi:hypothetical protein [Mesorhizobium sp. INR15]|uniref:hypothetical protein n=1 Tax=Mesorhizobium sp. INR15 TaxID=2654248 RepID=UPI0018965315|nr:hypothetical protein [Mesorhizobium sp. INR15]QPC95685.1 hypothetical protein GA829_34395 [Mesorhizobium sp. INR15]QPC96058.1 hypothetical protein GA829_36695 [Mesorhizobium sp. INR15]
MIAIRPITGPRYEVDIRDMPLGAEADEVCALHVDVAAMRAAATARHQLLETIARARDESKVYAIG